MGSDESPPPGEDSTLSSVPASTLTYIPSSHLLTTASTQQSLSGSGISLWDLANPRKPNDWADGVNADPNGVAWITGQTLAGATADETAIELWDVRYPHQPSVTAAIPIDRQDGVYTVLASPDSQILAAGITSRDVHAGGTVEMWNISADHWSLADFTQLPGDSENLAFSPDSHVLATNLSSAATGDQLVSRHTAPRPCCTRSAPTTSTTICARSSRARPSARTGSSTCRKPSTGRPAEGKPTLAFSPLVAGATADQRRHLAD